MKLGQLLTPVEKLEAWKELLKSNGWLLLKEYLEAVSSNSHGELVGGTEPAVMFRAAGKYSFIQQLLRYPELQFEAFEKHLKAGQGKALNSE